MLSNHIWDLIIGFFIYSCTIYPNSPNDISKNIMKLIQNFPFYTNVDVSEKLNF